jgi:sugar lactone lactonase YvrE
MTRPLSILFLVFIGWIVVTCRETDSIGPNRPPVADAGENQDITASELTVLDASGSSDPDGDLLGFVWEWIDRPMGSQAMIQPFDSITPAFVPDVPGVYRARVVVSDNVDTDADTVRIVATLANGAPVANAGTDAAVDLGTQFPLNGSGSDPNGDPLSYSWTLVTKPTGSEAAIVSPASQNTVVVIDVHGTYVIRLTVSDGTLSSFDEITLTTNAADITNINPTSGPHSITIKINGQNFSTTPDQNTVRINGVLADVTASTHTSIDATVPVGAGTGPVTVIVNGTTVSGPVFTYIQSPLVNTFSQFQTPFGIAVDGSGNQYISDFNNHLIRRLTPAGVLTVFAGDGLAGYADANSPLQARFNRPAGVAIHNGNLYIADNGNHCIRRISLATGIVTTYAGFPQAGYADGAALQAQFNGPIGLAADAQGTLYVGDTNNSRIRRIAANAQVSTIAGNGQLGFADGIGIAAMFNGITGVAIDANGILYVADALNHRVRRIDGQGAVTTFAGNGTTGLVNNTGTTARFNGPYDVATDGSNNVYVADLGNHAIRRITPQRVVTTIGGNGTAGMVDGTGAASRFNQPTSIEVASDGSIYVADFGNNRIRRITFE